MGRGVRIAIDARSLSVEPTGVGHFLLAAVNVWSEISQDVQFFLLSHKAISPTAQASLKQRQNVHFVMCAARIAPENGLWWLLWQFPKAAKALGAQYIWGAAGVLPLYIPRKIHSILTVHDLVYRSLPWTMASRTRIAYGLLAGRSIMRADVLWAVSEFTGREIDKFYPRRKNREIICGSGINPLRFEAQLSDDYVSEIARRYAIDARTLLFVGTVEPRKNLRFLLSLMPRLADCGVTLLIVGCRGWGDNGAVDFLNKEDFPRGAVRFCNYVSDAELLALYRSVSFLISTSLMEGFGLPQLEAMSVGCPVIAADNSAVSEVVQGGGVLVRGWDTDEWIGQILQALRERSKIVPLVYDSARVHDMHFPCGKVQRAVDALKG